MTRSRRDSISAFRTCYTPVARAVAPSPYNAIRRGPCGPAALGAACPGSDREHRVGCPRVQSKNGSEAMTRKDLMAVLGVAAVTMAATMATLGPALVGNNFYNSGTQLLNRNNYDVKINWNK